MNHTSLYATLKRLTLTAGLAACVAAPLAASAAPGARVTEAELDRYGAPLEIVRTRSPGKTAVTFEAEPEPLAEGSVAVIEIKSLGRQGAVRRWRCVAVDDVAECLGRPVRVPYFEEDQAMVLSVELAPEGLARAGVELARR